MNNYLIITTHGWHLTVNIWVMYICDYLNNWQSLRSGSYKIWQAKYKRLRLLQEKIRLFKKLKIWFWTQSEWREWSKDYLNAKLECFTERVNFLKIWNKKMNSYSVGLFIRVKYVSHTLSEETRESFLVWVIF